MKSLEAFGVAMLFSAGATAFAQPANDNCASPMNISPGVAVPYDTRNATAGDGSLSCNFFGEEHNVWFRYTAGKTGIAELVLDAAGCTAASDFVWVGVHSGNSCSNSTFYCDQPCGSAASFPITQGAQYLITVATTSVIANASGTFTINETVLPPPANDECSSAALISTGPGSYPVGFSGATTDATSYGCGIDPGHSDVWFEYVVQSTGGVFFNNMPVTVLNACGGAVLACDDANSLDGHDGVSLLATAGDHLFIRAALFGNDFVLPGELRTLTIAERTPPANNTCADAIVITDGKTNYSDVNATPTAPYPACGQAQSPSQRAVWFRYTAAAAGTVSVFANRTNNDFQNGEVTLAVFDSCDPGATPIDCGEPTSASPGAHKWVCFDASAGETFYIRASRRGDANSALWTLTVANNPAVSNDVCAAAVSLSHGVFTAWNNTGACNHDGDAETSCGGSQVNGSIWYSFTPNASGTAVFSTRRTGGGNSNSLDTVLEAFGACNGQVLACNDDVGTLRQSYIAVPASAGSPIYLRLAQKLSGNNTDVYRSGEVRVDLMTPEPNDACSGAIAITPGSIEIDNRNATTSSIEFTQCSFPNVTTKDLWYEWTAHASGTAAVSTCGPLISATFENIDTHLSVHEGNCSLIESYCNNNDLENHGNCTYTQSYIEFPVTAGMLYQFRIASDALSSFGHTWLVLEFDSSCAADFNDDGVRDVSDLFAYINAWLAKVTNADFNNDNAVDVSDLFSYINAWLAGC